LETPPKLIGFLANADPSAKMYAEFTKRTSLECGFRFEMRDVDKEELEDGIMEANNDHDVDGIMVYFPVFGDRQVVSLVCTNAGSISTAMYSPEEIDVVFDEQKDVEGLSHTWIQRMYHNIRWLDDAKTKKAILPCTPLAVIKVLEHLGVYNMILPYGNRLYGRTITIVNRSEIVGRPLAALLANDGAKVYSVDITGVQQYHRGVGIKLRKHEVSETSLTVEDVAPLSDVVITGVPAKDYKFPSHLIRDGAICVNFSSERNFDKEGVKERAAIYVPAIGKVTIAMLLRNLYLPQTQY
jgi:methylenetetrahydrofolate dehydrogenase (NAD+)